MRLVACAVAGLLALGAGSASAQSWGPDQRGAWGPAPGWVGPMTPERVALIVESMGLDPIGPPIRSGRVVVQRAADAYGRIMRVTIDPERRPSVVAEVPGAPAYGRPYPAYGEPTWRRPYPAYSAMSPYDDDPDEIAPPRYAPGPATPRVGAPKLPPIPKERSAVATPATPLGPAKPPVPRKRPEAAQITKKTEPGAVSPLPAPGNAAPQGTTPPGAPDAKRPAQTETPPVNPLY